MKATIEGWGGRAAVRGIVLNLNPPGTRNSVLISMAAPAGNRMGR